MCTCEAAACGGLRRSYMTVHGTSTSGEQLHYDLSNMQAACWQGIASWTTLRTIALLVTSMLLAGAANLFAGLWFLHTLLAATGQTTYEAMKGWQLPESITFLQYEDGSLMGN